MELGITSYAFRYLLQDLTRAPSLEKIIEMTRSFGLGRLQICENGHPLDLSVEKWKDLIRWAAGIGVEVQLGCKTLDLRILELNLERVAETSSKTLRIVLEGDSGTPPSRLSLSHFVEEAVSRSERTGARLAIENYFSVPSRVLAEIVRGYPPSLVGFCVDSANSLRNFESPLNVLNELGERAFCFHLKDYKVTGDNVGFSVMGAPLGKGDLQLDCFLDAVFGGHSSPEIYLENWVPASGKWEDDVEADARWLHESILNLRGRLAHKGV